MRPISLAVTLLFLVGACQQPKPARMTGEEASGPRGESTHYTLPAGGEGGVSVVATRKISATLFAGGKETRITGRTSFHLIGSSAQLKKGEINVGGFNVVFFVVPQQLIAGDRKIDVEEGVVGFVASGGKVQHLDYDPRTGVVKGEIRGFVDAAYMAKLIKKGASDGPGDEVITETQPATLSLVLRFERPLNPDLKDIQEAEAVLEATLRVEKEEADGKPMPPFHIELEPKLKIPVQIGSTFIIEAGRELCIQPVRIGRIKNRSSRFSIPLLFITFTGQGLAFGQPGANTQWAKADVVFSYRDWKTLFKPDFFVVSSSEEDDLRDEVQDDDCVEVFFVDDFDPEDNHGCGVTFGSGSAATQIISSDANARGGIDLTHLAHELGHALGLRHPDATATATAQPGSTGTLMCPSGCLKDNPTRNSQENKDNVSNPLLTFVFKIRSPGLDCQDSTDCGDCP